MLHFVFSLNISPVSLPVINIYLPFIDFLPVFIEFLLGSELGLFVCSNSLQCSIKYGHSIREILKTLFVKIFVNERITNFEIFWFNVCELRGKVMDYYTYNGCQKSLSAIGSTQKIRENSNNFVICFKVIRYHFIEKI